MCRGSSEKIKCESRSMKTLILGATPNPSRYAFIASGMLLEYGHEIVPVGIRSGKVSGVQILDLKQRPMVDAVDTITMYVGKKNQPIWYDYLISLKPRRIIFNPGAENYEFEQLATANGIETIQACTLVMLRTGQY